MPTVIFFWMYWIGLKGLPENPKPVPPNKYNELICEVIWLESGGTGPIRMIPIRFKHFLEPLFIQTSDFDQYLKKLKEITPASSGITRFASRQLLHQRNHPKLYRRWHFYNIVTEIWVSRNWTGQEAVSSFAEWSYFGHGTYGIVDASKKYFNKRPDELSLEEVAVIIGITQSPSRYNPWCNSELALKRTNDLLEKIYIERHERNNFRKLESLPKTLLPAPVDVCKHGA